MTKEITIENKLSELERVAGFVDGIGQTLGLDGELLMNLQLVLEEMVSNIIFYAYAPQTTDSIGLTVECDGKALSFTLTDGGRAFDPTTRGELDTSVSPAERETGGAGIFLAKNIMDAMNYRRQNGKNVLTMVKRL